MSVFGNCDERILIEEIVEAECEEQETEFCRKTLVACKSSLSSCGAVKARAYTSSRNTRVKIPEGDSNTRHMKNRIYVVCEGIHTKSNDFTSGGETIDENSVAGSIVLAEVTDTQELLVSELIVDNNSSGDSSNGTLRDDNNTKHEIVRVISEDSEVTIGANCRLSRQNGGVARVTPRSHMEQEKRMRREIANSNERRRMQSINAGFQSLRTLLPHHEGEKLSKAAILQQTAEYIYQLEQEKTQLLSQNCQLKRLVNQHEGGDVPIKKRKAETQGVVVSLPIHVNESGDEGLGSMSPEPMSVITVSTEGHAVISNNNGTSISDVAELRRQLERERQQRLLIEKQMRAIQTQLYPERFRDNQLIAYQPHEVIEHTDNVMAQETEEAVAALQVVSVVSLPPVGSTQTVETSNPDPCSPPLSPQTAEIVAEDLKEEETPPESPKIVAFSTNQVFASAIEETNSVGSFSPSRVGYATTTTPEFKGDFKNTTSTAQFITASPPRPFSPPAEPQRLPSVLEAAIKAEPKVEVERLPSPANSLDDGTPQARLYLANTSRQNLETIVEAIRHLEGDHLFSDEPAQDVPLALTNKQAIVGAAATTTTSNQSITTTGTITTTKQRLRHAEVNNLLQFHTQQQTQQRPGVIVVKHS